MKSKLLLILGSLGILLGSCNNDNKDDQVVSQRYVHKYGYAVSKQEWDKGYFPGQVITTLKNGVTVTSTYENSVLHGPSTHTYPHSQTIETYNLYNHGNLVKEVCYDIKGMPLRETVQISPSRRSITLWYAEGAPMSVEEYTNDELLEGQYFTANNEVEAKVEKGNGQRILRNPQGLLLSKEDFETGFSVKKETFYPNGSPESISFYDQGKLHGEKRTFASSGEPLSIEEWVKGRLHGKATYFKNGAKYHEISYLYGNKFGKEILYKDGDSISQEITWENDVLHGPSTYYIEGMAQTTWYYDGKELSKARYEELVHLDNVIRTGNGYSPVYVQFR